MLLSKDFPSYLYSFQALIIWRNCQATAYLGNLKKNSTRNLKYKIQILERALVFVQLKRFVVDDLATNPQRYTKVCGLVVNIHTLNSDNFDAYYNFTQWQKFKRKWFK